MAESTARHTPIPWKADDTAIRDANNEFFMVAKTLGFDNHEARANANFIVTAVNSRDALTAQVAELREALTVLEELATYYSMPNTALLNAALDKARAALAKGGE